MDGFITPANFHESVLLWFRVTVQLLDWLMIKASLLALGYVAISYVESAKSTSSTPPIRRKHRRKGRT